MSVDQSVQTAIDTLASQSAAWQQTLTTLEGNLAQQTSALAKQVLGEVQDLLANTIGAAGNQLECDSDFVGTRVRETLENIKAAIEKQPPPNPPSPHACQVIPASISVADIDSGLLSVATVDGFDMGTDADQIYICGIPVGGIQANQQCYGNQQQAWLAHNTPYQLSLNVSNGSGMGQIISGAAGNEELAVLELLDYAAGEPTNIAEWNVIQTATSRVAPATAPKQADNRHGSGSLTDLNIIFANVTQKDPQTGVTVDLGRGLATWAQPAPEVYPEGSLYGASLAGGSAAFSVAWRAGTPLRMCGVFKPGKSWSFDWRLTGKKSTGGTYQAQGGPVRLDSRSDCITESVPAS